METDPLPRGRRPAGAIPLLAGGLVLVWLGAAAAQEGLGSRLALALPLQAPASEEPPAFPGELRKGQQEFTFLLGYGDQLDIPRGRKSEDREFLFITPRWGIVLTGPVGRSFWRGGLEFLTEPSANITADTGPRILSGGIAALVKYNFYTGTRLIPFIEGGAGLIVSTDRFEGQGSAFNFTPQGGAGFHYFFTPQWAFTGAYRYWHASNAGIAEPNRGVNASTFFVGLAYFFP